MTRPLRGTLGAVRETGVRDYLRGALWAYPTIAVLAALAAGTTLARISVPQDSWAHRLLFQGSAEDSRTLLLGISGTMITVIALVLGLTLVALQLTSTQFSPRILRTFLRDQVNQILLSVFVATFVYSTAGLYTVGIGRSADYPRLAVTVAVVLLFASVLALIYFVHHVAHSIQIDKVMEGIERRTSSLIEHDLPGDDADVTQPPTPPDWATPVLATRSGYVQQVRAERVLRTAGSHDHVVEIVPMLGDHVIKGAPLAWIWPVTHHPQHPVADAVVQAVHSAVRIGFERTSEHDVAFGVRQLADVAVKALSPGINDPYTAIQAIDHISVLLAALAAHPLGAVGYHDANGAVRLIVPGRDLDYYVELAVGQVRRFGGAEPRVARAVLRVLTETVRFCRDDDGRSVIARQIDLVVEAAAQSIRQGSDLASVVSYGEHARAICISPARDRIPADATPKESHA